MVRTRRAAQLAEPLIGRPSWNRALEVPEILSIIFQHATKDTGAVSLRVCRFWFDVGIEVLWRDLDAVIPLFSLLATLTFEPSEKNGGCWTGPSVGNLLTTNWKRFRMYASHVKSLTYDGNAPWGGQTRSRVSSATIEAIAFHHPFGQSLLPNLQTLVWKCRPFAPIATMLSIMPFLSASITKLELHHLNSYHPSARVALLSILQALEYRCPCLQTFLLDTSSPSSLLQDTLLTWLNGFDGLSQITLPPHFISQRVMEALNGHKALWSIKVNPSRVAAVLDDEPLRCPPGSFNSLLILELNAACNRVAELFLDAVFLQLEGFSLTSTVGTSPEDLQNITSVVSTSCPRLFSISLKLHAIDTSLPFSEGYLTVEHIRSLLRCPNIVILAVLHNYPFIISPSDVEEMASRWPRLQSLLLCPTPNVPAVWTDSTAGNPIGILQCFARQLPALEMLGIYINSSEPAALLDNDIPVHHRFRKLALVAVGVSKVPGNDPVTVASFIESVTISMPELRFGVYTTYRGNRPPPSLMEEASRWAEATRALQIFRKKRLAVTQVP